MEELTPIMYVTPEQIDERWMAEYVAYGLRQFQDLLANHQAFHRYLARQPA